MTRMVLTHWNVYHCYSTYLLEPFADLAGTAAQLVDGSLAEVVLCENDLSWRRRDGGVERQRLVIQRERATPQGKFTVPPNLSGFALEGALQAVWLAEQDRYLFRDSVVPPSARAFLGPITVTYEHAVLHFYPQVKLYQSGIILTQFRVLSGGQLYPVEEFVDQQLNLFRFKPVHVGVPPGLIRAYAAAVAPDGVWNHLKLWKHRADLERWLREKAFVTEDDEFGLPQVSLEDLNLADLEGETEALSCPRFLARLVEVSVWGSLREALSAPRDKLPLIGSFWCGRPNIFIIAFENQAASSLQIADDFREQLATIMCGVNGLPRSTNWAELTGPNLRLFDDYAVFLSRSTTLWVCSKRAIESGDEKRNWAEVIYDKQVQSEMIDYLYASHRQQEERSTQSRTTVRQFVAEEARLANLERLVAEASPFGEIAGLLARGDEVLSSDIRRRTQENLRRRVLVASEERELRERRFGWLLTVLLSAAGISSLATSAVLPLWTWSGLPHPTNQNTAVVCALGISALVMAIAIVSVWRLFRPAE